MHKLSADLQLDAEIVAGLRRGEGATFDRAYQRYHRAIYSFLLRLCGRRDVAEDLFQETWIQVARHAVRLVEDTDLRAWLYTIARNRHRSHRRWAILHTGRLRELADEPPGTSANGPPKTPYDQAAAAADLAGVEAALFALPAQSREVLLLIFVEGFTPEQAAQVLGLQPPALRKRLQWARAELAKRLPGE